MIFLFDPIPPGNYEPEIHGAIGTFRRRARVWHKSDGYCWLCFEPIDFLSGWHADHWIPRSYNGPDTIENLWPAHAACNMARGNALPSSDPAIVWPQPQFIHHGNRRKMPDISKFELEVRCGSHTHHQA